MPHFRQKTEGGVFVPLQSSRAFTNRAMRFRQPKAIIPKNPRKGTTTIAEYVRSHLEKHNAETAEEVPELTPAELKKAKRANKGKFSMNSRYYDEGDNASKSGHTKRKAEEESGDSGDENTNSRAKRVKTEPNSPPSSRKYAPLPTPHGRSARIRSVSQSGQSASQGLSDPEMALWVPYSEAEEREKPLVPLFVSLDCEELAVIQDASYTTPKIVLEAKANGCTMLNEVEIRWYRDDVEREVDEDGIEHPYVVMREEWESGKKDRQGDNGKDDDDGGSMAPNDLDRDDNVPHLLTVSETAQPPIFTQDLARASAAPPTSPLIYYTLGLDDAEPQLYENLWLYDYGPSGF